MSLVQSKLKNDLLAAFNSMTDGDDTVFAKKVSKAVADFAQSGKISTTDAGAISAGTFTGKGTGSISVQSSICENIILSACKAMRNMTSGGDSFLAEKIASGIHTMISSGKVSTSVNGTVVPPSGTPSGMGGSAKGTMNGVSATIQSGLISAFRAMGRMTSGGDSHFAEQAASAVNKYLKAASIMTNGTGGLAGSIGSGNMM